MNALSLTDLFSCNINQGIKELKNNNWHEEKSARRTVSSLGATSKPKTRVANNIKHAVEKTQKKPKNRSRNNASP
ncbi:hypothetical protein MtrunA17_Chr7g0214941 [Medicago truncatula]|uniref:Uncharacterized protein n=1 Tax=Medicago truncatula TaxID=3880 RepID=A0A396GX21_MEDTR|nr:hypothetical protein MtrunA17_Chr7g0214941 [Medicago truncatula]